MNANTELLNFIYQNSQMGVETLKQLIPMIESESFRKQVTGQLKEYSEINEEAKKLLNQNSCDEKGISMMEKVMAYLMIDMKTLLNQSSAHMAEMMLKGSNMGIIDATKKIKQYEGKVEADIVALMNRLLKFEEKNVEKLKEYL